MGQVHLASLGLMFVILNLAALAQAQNAPVRGVWAQVNELPRNRAVSNEWIRPRKFRAFHLDHAALRETMARAPREFTPAAQTAPAAIDLPMPDGSLARFLFVEAPVMAPELAAKFSQIRTFRGQGVDDPAASVRFDFTPAGFHAQILSPRGAVYIDPLYRNDANLHASYFKRDYIPAPDGWRCFTPSGDSLAARSALPLDLARSGSNLRTYRLAVAATGEYTAYHGGTVTAGMSAIVTAVNRVTGVYETELAIRLVLVANNDLIVYTNPNTDPYSNNNASSLLNQNQSNLDSVIGSANYDIGHVFSTAGGGLAGLGVVCVSGSKARGETGTSTPVGDAYYIDYVAHEMGHQFGANHTFNSSTGSCGGGNRNASTAYEPGSGSTIMAYAGICGSDDLQLHSDPYFHSISFDEILAYTTTSSGNSCAVITSTGNTAPTVSAGANYTIPMGTPFVLAATGSDPNGDALTYCWEERDLGPSITLTTPDNGSSPLFRSFNPTTNAWRTFPQLSDILNNTTTPGEMLPTASRTMSFRVTARDNRAGGGGVNTADIQGNVVSTAGPFTVTSHNSGGTFSNLTTVTWNVAGTAASPINAANVNILLSTNGGQTFPITLVVDTPNDGAETVVLPNINTSTARIKVEAAGNIFFDICNANFAVVPGVPTPLVALDSTTLVAEGCAPTNNAIDPGETVTVNIALRNTGSGDTTHLVATLLATNGVTVPSGAQNYGVVTAGGALVSRPFTFMANGDCGSQITTVLQLQDGSANLGTISQALNLGALTSVTLGGTNATAIAIPANGTKGKAAPYPSTIFISGITGTVSKVTVTLVGLSHGYPDDVDAVLVGPTGQTVMLMSDTGGANAINNLTLTFDDAAADSLPDAGQITSGTFRPTDFETASDSFPSPAPAGPFGQTLSLFNGLNPNGNWSLYIQDDQSRDTGSLALGWRLNITTSNAECCISSVSTADVALGQAISPSAVNIGNNVTFTLNITNLGPSAAGSVTVTDTLPAGLSFVSATSSQGTNANNAGVVTCALGSMTNTTSATVTIQAIATVAGSWTNTATVSSSTVDPANSNNTASATVFVNSPPTISSIADVATDENTPVGPVAFTVWDLETPPAALTLSAASSNTNLVALADIVFDGSGSNRTVIITPATNQFGTTTITLTVSDGMASASDSFVLTVNPVNHPPVLAPIPDQMVHALMTVCVTNSATDPDLPAQTLSFSLETNVPAGAVIDLTNGVFLWTPSDVELGTNAITIRAMDNGSPPLSDAKTFTVTVFERPVLQASVTSSNEVTLTWTAIPDRVYRVQFMNDFSEATWQDLAPDVTATEFTASKVDTLDASAQRFYRVLVVR